MIKIHIAGDSNTAKVFREKVSNRKYRNDVVILETDLEEVDVFFVLYDDDTMNIQKCLNIRSHTNSQIYSKFKNSKFGERAKSYIVNLDFITPSVIVADRFIQSLEGASTSHIKPQKFKISFKPFDPLIRKSISAILYIVALSILYFHFILKYPFFESLYITIKTMATGDTEDIFKTVVSKVFYIFLMISAVTSMAIIFALLGDSINSRRKELIMGINRYRGHGHIIIVGGGSVAYNVIKKLIKKGEKIVLIDTTIDGPYISKILKLGVPFIIGDARDETLLSKANVTCCKAVMSLTQNDMTNLEVGLDVKTISPGIRVILRIFDQEMSDDIKKSGIIKYNHSMSYIAAEHLLNKLNL